MLGTWTPIYWKLCNNPEVRRSKQIIKDFKQIMTWLSLHRGLYLALEVKKNCHMSGEVGNMTPIPFTPMVQGKERTASFAFLLCFLYKLQWEPWPLLNGVAIRYPGINTVL